MSSWVACLADPARKTSCANMSEQLFEIWATKYALTEGIQHLKAGRCLHSPNMVYVPSNGYYLHGEGRDWHRTEEAAKARAEAMRKAKIQSLKRSIQKLQKLSF